MKSGCSCFKDAQARRPTTVKRSRLYSQFGDPASKNPEPNAIKAQNSPRHEPWLPLLQLQPCQKLEAPKTSGFRPSAIEQTQLLSDPLAEKMPQHPNLTLLINADQRSFHLAWSYPQKMNVLYVCELATLTRRLALTDYHMSVSVYRCRGKTLTTSRIGLVA